MAKTKKTSKTTKNPAPAKQPAAPAKKPGAPAKQPAAAKQPAGPAKQPAGPAKKPAAPAKQPAGPDPSSEFLFPGQVEIATASGVFVEDLPQQAALPAHALVAARLTAAQLRPYIYVVHEASADQLITVLAYVDTAALGGKAGAGLRVPQQGAWLWCPSQGMILVLASPRRLDYAQIVEAVGGRAPDPAKGNETNVRTTPK